MTTRRGLLVVISGPSGVGKDTIIERLLELDSNLTYSVSCTTRAPRPGEVDGTHYTFISRERFEELIEKGHFLENASYGPNLYGTPMEPVKKRERRGVTCSSRSRSRARSRCAST